MSHDPFACVVCGERHTAIPNGCAAWIDPSRIQRPDDGPWRLKGTAPAVRAARARQENDTP